MGREVREKHHLPWRPIARAGLGPAALVHGVRLSPGNAHVGVAVQESQNREGHPRPACRGRTEMEEQLEMPGRDLPQVQAASLQRRQPKKQHGLSFHVKTHAPGKRALTATPAS